MRLTLLAAVASAALISSGALAQDNTRHETGSSAATPSEAPASATHAQSTSPRATQAEEKPATGAERQGNPRAAQGEERRGEASGEDEGHAAQHRAAASTGAEDSSGARRAQTGERPDQRPPARTGATEERRNSNERAGATEQRNAARTGVPEQADRSQAGAGETRENQTRTGATKERGGARTESAEGRGQPKVVGNVRTSTEHASRASDILMRTGRRENVNVDVRVGARLPEAVAILPVPEQVISFAPEYRGYDYFIDNDEIVFVAPSTHEVVGMIEYEGRAAANDETHVRAARPCPTED